MAKTKTAKKAKPPATTTRATPSLEDLYTAALSALSESDLQTAKSHAETLLQNADPALDTSNRSAIPNKLALPALNLLGEISVELGDQDTARRYFLLAVNGDPEGAIPDEVGGGAEKFLWLAQLSEDGGEDSVAWFERGVKALKKQVSDLENTLVSTNGSSTGEGTEIGDREMLVLEKRAKIATALCGVSEIYMTDLSWDDAAEDKCESLITEALMFAPENAGVLQTVASVRLSQSKIEDAQSALKRSLGLWRDLDPEDEGVPDFASRVSLARLLMEAEIEDEAMEVLERLALEDDQSVEACYLGGWCLHLLAEKRKAASGQTNGVIRGGHSNGQGDDTVEDEFLDTLKVSRTWLLNTLRLYDSQQYEDERLKAHTLELVESLNQVLGPPPDNANAEDEDEVEWEAESSDEEMS